MEDKEVVEIYEQIEKTLNELGMRWVTAQVNDQIRQGKTVEKEIETLKEGRMDGLFTIDEYPKLLRKGPKETYPVTIDYSPAERLKLLLDAIEHSIISTAAMETHLTAFFANEIKNEQIAIEFNLEDPNGKTLVVGKESAIERQRNSQKLKALLDLLRHRIAT